jgi:glucosylceramidase
MKKNFLAFLCFILMEVFVFASGSSEYTAPAYFEKDYPVAKVTVFQTSKAGDNLTAQKAPALEKKKPASGVMVITLQPEEQFQSLLGFGGSFTESSAYVLGKLDPAKRKEVIDAYFAADGAAYSMTRTHINSCDFSLGHYSYDETAGDTELANFSIQPDMDDLVPLIKDDLAAPGASFQILASPWSPPAWMKTNNNMVGGKLKSDLYPVWAKYLSRYVQEYARQGITISYLTPQNEPGNVGMWDTCGYSPNEEKNFMKILGPLFKQENPDVKILVFDHNKGAVNSFVTPIYKDADAGQYAWGAAVHWYDTHTGSEPSWNFEALGYVHKNFPDKHILHTEGCITTGTYEGRYWEEMTNSWEKAPMVPAERYAHDIIGDLNSWAEGWIDWNIVLDHKGGPNLAKNYCSAPVLVNTDTKAITYNPSFYILKSFSRYFRPGAKRIGLYQNNEDKLLATACVNPDGRYSLAVLNEAEKACKYQVQIGNKNVSMEIPGHALQTVIIE